ncbi:MAG: hypothetical protein CVT70_11785 [Alphaproteobacteria bacterium HGW-Alphaproteobacteria-1]|jgi:hypothetical protein|nr:MAG: hypothetical protein CVT70_11785 [Alphaproteobacteria bacterium HGW-Alphaproteobacteria-1]
MAMAQAPLSAIDWLTETPTVTVTPQGPPVSEGAEVPDISVTALDAPRADAVGLLPATVTGLPTTLWENSTTAALTRYLDRLPDRPLPALQALYYTLLLAEANPPPDTGAEARFLNARLAALRRFGAVEPALALVERAGGDTPALFDAWLDLALLEGSEDMACKALARTPHLSRDSGARAYCLARAGDWETAALILHGAEVTGTLGEADVTLLALYLEPELIDEIDPPEPPNPMTPLRFRLFEAIGAPLGTRDLPRAFAMADLRGTAGWKAEIEAAERLAETGAVAGVRLFGLYTARKRAASGGVWERVAAMQALDAALAAGNAEALARTLPEAWAAAQELRLQTVLADIFAERLLGAPLDTATRPLASEIVALSSLYERASEILPPSTPRQRLLAGLARGTPQADDAVTPLESAIVDAFTSAAPAPEHRTLIDGGRLGEAILAAATQLDAASARAAPSATRAALSTLRAVGLEDSARRAALQLLLLGPAR